ncbi:MAG: conjugal transfer protein TraG N-terminal domain-containing protein, partial [Pseudomonadota bacterium]
MRTLLRFAPVLLMFLPASAHALTMEYLTYNAFDETAAAFKRLGLIMSDPGFIVLAGCFVAVSGIGATLMFGTNAIGRGGQGAHPMSMFAPFLIGTVVFWGAVVPKGTLQIYDPVRNKTEAVPDIPALIVLLAGGLSTVEKGMTTMVDTASANPYKDDVGGISYSLIFGAVKASTPLYNLDRSMAQYFKDCGMTAIGSGYNGASMQEVVKGVAGSDLYAAFSKWNHPAWGTVWFQEGNDAGVTGSCADSWAYLDSKLNGEITTVMNPMKRAACESAGFNWSDGAQVAACDTILQDAAAKFDSPTATSEVLLRAIMMGKSITLALNDPDFNVGINTLVNRQMMSEAFGASAAMNQWIPRLRGIMIAVAVGVTPICLLFVATPLVTRALAVVVGLYIWLALWGICDVIAVQMQQDAAFDAFTEVKRHFLGYEAIMNAPEGAVAALGVFGKARTMAMVLATVLCGGLFKLSSSYAFTSMGQQWQGDFNQGGEAAGKQRLQVEQQAALQDQLVNAPGSMGRVQQFGYDTAVGGANYGAQQQFAQYDYLADVTGGVTGDLAYRAGELSGGQALGNVRGGEEYAGRMGMPLGAAASVVAQASAVGSAGSTMGARTRAEQNVPGGYFEATSFESQ